MKLTNEDIKKYGTLKEQKILNEAFTVFDKDVRPYMKELYSVVFKT